MKLNKNENKEIGTTKNWEASRTVMERGELSKGQVYRQQGE